MKSQDVGLLLKLVSLQRQERGLRETAYAEGWQDWEKESQPEWLLTSSLDEAAKRDYSVRALANMTGISKSQVSLSLKRCLDVGLLRHDRRTGLPRANARALYEFVVYGLRYVFPAKLGAVTRGIGTAFAAPVLQEKLFSAGELVPVWPDARGNTKGQAVEPLFKTATMAVRQDPYLYELLALVDAIRIGQPRERNLAKELLHSKMELKA